MVRCGSPLILFRVLDCKNLLLSSAHFLQEGKERHKAIIISRVKKLLHESLGLFLGELLTKVGEETEEFILKHSVVLIFVIKLKNFNEVVESTLVLGVFASLVHGEDISLGEHLLSLLRLTSNLLNGLEGWIQVASTDEISGIEGINFAISLEVIDIEGEFDGYKQKNSSNYLLIFTHRKQIKQNQTLTGHIKHQAQAGSVVDTINIRVNILIVSDNIENDISSGEKKGENSLLKSALECYSFGFQRVIIGFGNVNV